MKSIALVWDDIGAYGGVRTQLLQALRQLPEFGYQPWLLDWTVHPSEWDAEVNELAGSIVPVHLAPRTSERASERAVHKILAERMPDAVLFAEWRHAEDVLRGCPDEISAVNLCLVDRPDDAYYRFAVPLLPRLDAVIGNSHRITGHLRAGWPDLGSKIHDLFTGVPIPAESLRTERGAQPLRILFMARLEQAQKRAGDLIPLVHSLDVRGVDYQLTIVGDGPEKAGLDQAFSGHGRVTLTGALSYPDAMIRYQEADVLLLTSAYEGMPLVVLHALVAGLIPVCTGIESGISQLQSDGAPVQTYPVGDMDAATSLLEGLATDRVRCEELRQSARGYGQGLDIRKTVSGLADILDKLTWPSRNVWQGFSAPADPPGTGWKNRLRRRMPS